MPQPVDFNPVHDDNAAMAAYAQQFTLDDIRATANASLDTILGILGDANDAAMTFIPNDPHADDAGAPEEERYQGWSLAHLVAHVTASTEEYAAISSMLARSVVLPYGLRLRWEPPWKTITTRAQVLQRIEESRRMRVAYYDAWPDVPNLTNLRDVSERYKAMFGEQNARSCALIGLYHEWIHLNQFREVAAQAAAAQVVGT